MKGLRRASWQVLGHPRRPRALLSVRIRCLLQKAFEKSFKGLLEGSYKALGRLYKALGRDLGGCRESGMVTPIPPGKEVFLYPGSKTFDLLAPQSSVPNVTELAQTNGAGPRMKNPRGASRIWRVLGGGIVFLISRPGKGPI